MSGSWSATGNLYLGCVEYTATLLPNGMVLVAGGDVPEYEGMGILNYARLYDPVSGTWSLSDFLVDKIFRHTATLLSNGKVLVAGGLMPVGDGTDEEASASAELYVSAEPLITSPIVASGTVGLPFVYQFEATDATSLEIKSLDLPPGLTFDSSLSAIIGEPEQDGTFQVGLTASNPVAPRTPRLPSPFSRRPSRDPYFSAARAQRVEPEVPLPSK